MKPFIDLERINKDREKLNSIINSNRCRAFNDIQKIIEDPIVSFEDKEELKYLISRNVQIEMETYLLSDMNNNLFISVVSDVKKCPITILDTMGKSITNIGILTLKYGSNVDKIYKISFKYN